jgi:hypothetical protein
MKLVQLGLRSFVAPALGVVFAAVSSLAQNPPGPAPEHAVLKKMEGDWNAAIKSMGSESSGTQSARMECGGLWLVTNFQAEFAGQQFQGRGLGGYDPESKKFISIWVDSMGPKPMRLEGTYDKEKKTLTMRGEGFGPDGKPAKYKNETKIKDDDHHTFIMYVVGADGSEDEVMKIEYSRKK